MSRLLWLLGLPAILFVLIGVTVRWDQGSAPPKPKAGEYEKVHVEVLNGCGKDGMAHHVGRHLRGLGFDVVTIGNAETFTYPESIVIDRVGKPEYASLVAAALGTRNQIQQIIPDPFRIEEVTVVIGRDYGRLSVPPPR